MLKHILVPLDGSKLSEKALDAARRLLSPNGKLTLLTIVQPANPPLTPYPSVQAVDDIADVHDDVKHSTKQAEDYIERMAQNLLLQGINARTEIIAGEPAKVIVERATKLGVEIIVMSTHGRSGLSKLLFGSVTENVLHHTPCPVLIVPNREQERTPDSATDSELGSDILPAL